MKNEFVSRSPRSLILCSLLLLSMGLASSLHAGPGPQYWESLRQRQQFEKLKSGDKIGYVCNECKTISEITVESHGHAMQFCKEGGNVSCPSCTAKTKVILKRQRNDPPSRAEIAYVNEKGEECAFVAKVAEKAGNR